MKSQNIKHYFIFLKTVPVTWAVCLLLSGAVSSDAHETPKPPAKPVARLVSTSAEEAPARVRARLIGVSSAPKPPREATNGAPRTPMAATVGEQRAFDLINDQRRTKNRKSLEWDSELCRLARMHSENMARHGFLSHVDQDGLDTTGRASSLSIVRWQALGENIAYNQGFDDPAAFAVERWMSSDMHRDNILNAGFTHSGLGVARSADGRVFFTQVFLTR